MSSREMTIWIDERWYNALSRHLKDETLEEYLELHYGPVNKAE